MRRVLVLMWLAGSLVSCQGTIDQPRPRPCIDVSGEPGLLNYMLAMSVDIHGSTRTEQQRQALRDEVRDACRTWLRGHYPLDLNGYSVRFVAGKDKAGFQPAMEYPEMSFSVMQPDWR